MKQLEQAARELVEVLPQLVGCKVPPVVERRLNALAGIVLAQPQEPAPGDALSHAWKSGRDQAKEEAALDHKFCPHCNPCTNDGNDKCRAPGDARPPAREAVGIADAIMDAQRRWYETGEGALAVAPVSAPDGERREAIAIAELERLHDTLLLRAGQQLRGELKHDGYEAYSYIADQVFRIGERLRAAAHEPPARTEALAVGDLVAAISPGEPLRCGSGEYAAAVVVSLDPFILVSEEGDMLWQRFPREDVKRVGRATDHAMRTAMDRFKRDAAQAEPPRGEPAQEPKP